MSLTFSQVLLKSRCLIKTYTKYIQAIFRKPNKIDFYLLCHCFLCLFFFWHSFRALFFLNQKAASYSFPMVIYKYILIFWHVVPKLLGKTMLLILKFKVLDVSESSSEFVYSCENLQIYQLLCALWHSKGTWNSPEQNWGWSPKLYPSYI